MYEIKCLQCFRAMDKDSIALNKKLLGRGTKQFHCLECLADYLGTTTDDLNIKIEEFKEQGCVLFN